MVSHSCPLSKCKVHKRQTFNQLSDKAGMFSYKNIRPTSSGGNEGKWEEGAAGSGRSEQISGMLSVHSLHRCPGNQLALHSWYRNQSPDYPQSRESPWVLHKCSRGLRRALLPKTRTFVTRKSPNPSLQKFFPYRSQDSNVGKTYYKQFSFLKFLMVDRQTKW